MLFRSQSTPVAKSASSENAGDDDQVAADEAEEA